MQMLVVFSRERSVDVPKSGKVVEFLRKPLFSPKPLRRNGYSVVFSYPHFSTRFVAALKSWERVLRWQEGDMMQKKSYKGRSVKRTLSKCPDCCRTYSDIQYAYADMLEADKKVKQFRCNVPLDGPGVEEYTSDFVIVWRNGDMAVRECVKRDLLNKPRTARLLDSSRRYWLSRGVQDWGLVVDADEQCT